MYLRAIKAIQPRGPYHLGDWAVGGVLASEASKQLIESGDLVSALFLIGAPCPNVVPTMSIFLIGLLDYIDIFAQLAGTTESYLVDNRQALLKHFDGTVRNLALYKSL